jgi:hypothetical protein
MEPEGSLPCSQKSATGPYPESVQSSPHFHVLYMKLILSFHRRLVLPSYLFLLGFPTKTMYVFLILRYN